APTGAEATPGGYEMAWKLAGTSQYSVWLADSNGNMTTNPTGVVAGTSSALRAYEPSFHQDLNGDTVIGSMSLADGGTAGGSLTITGSFGGSTVGGSGTVTLVGNNASSGGTTVGRGLPLGNSGTVTNDGSVGLAVTDFTNGDAGGSMNLAVMGDFMASTFVPPAGQSGGTILSAGPSQPDNLAKPTA